MNLSISGDKLAAMDNNLIKTASKAEVACEMSEPEQSTRNEGRSSAAQNCYQFGSDCDPRLGW